MASFTSDSAERTQELGESLAQVVIPDDVIVLNGDLGAGKTQFAKGFAKGLGVTDEVTSPTFSTLVDYEGDNLTLHHFDLYRLDEEDELDDVDFFEALESGGVSLVEWGDKFPQALPEEYLEVAVKSDSDGTRVIEMHGHGSRGAELEDAFATW